MSEGFACEFASRDTGGSRACGIDGVSFDSSREECHHPLTMEDARLYAAAPELLAALWAIVRITDGSQPKDYPGALMVARAAIRKAEEG